VPLSVSMVVVHTLLLPQHPCLSSLILLSLVS